MVAINKGVAQRLRSGRIGEEDVVLADTRPHRSRDELAAVVMAEARLDVAEEHLGRPSAVDPGAGQHGADDVGRHLRRRRASVALERRADDDARPIIAVLRPDAQNGREVVHVGRRHPVEARACMQAEGDALRRLAPIGMDGMEGPRPVDAPLRAAILRMPRRLVVTPIHWAGDDAADRPADRVGDIRRAVLFDEVAAFKEGGAGERAVIGGAGVAETDRKALAAVLIFKADGAVGVRVAPVADDHDIVGAPAALESVTAGIGGDGRDIAAHLMVIGPPALIERARNAPVQLLAHERDGDRLADVRQVVDDIGDLADQREGAGVHLVGGARGVLALVLQHLDNEAVGETGQSGVRIGLGGERAVDTGSVRRDRCRLSGGEHLQIACGELAVEQRLVGAGEAGTAQARHVGGEGVNHRWSLRARGGSRRPPDGPEGRRNRSARCRRRIGRPAPPRAD